MCSLQVMPLLLLLLCFNLSVVVVVVAAVVVAVIVVVALNRECEREKSQRTLNWIIDENVENMSRVE